MYTKTIIAGAALAAISLIPSCPAPPAIPAIITGLAAPLAGELLFIGLNDNLKRDGFVKMARRQEFPPGVSQESIDQCTAANEGRQLTVTQTAENALRVENVAPECMNLAAIFTQEGTPIPCGSACLDYVNLSAADMQTLMDIINNLL